MERIRRQALHGTVTSPLNSTLSRPCEIAKRHTESYEKKLRSHRNENCRSFDHRALHRRIVWASGPGFCSPPSRLTNFWHSRSLSCTVPMAKRKYPPPTSWDIHTDVPARLFCGLRLRDFQKFVAKKELRSKSWHRLLRRRMSYRR